MANIDVTVNPTVTTLEVAIVDSGNTYVVKPVVTNNIGGGGTSLHSGLVLDDGTNPHATTKADVGLGNAANTDFTSAVDLNTDKVGVTNEEENTINTTTTGEPTGSDLVLNVVSLLQAEYDAGAPVATTLYVITDA